MSIKFTLLLGTAAFLVGAAFSVAYQPPEPPSYVAPKRIKAEAVPYIECCSGQGGTAGSFRDYIVIGGGSGSTIAVPVEAPKR